MPLKTPHSNNGKLFLLHLSFKTLLLIVITLAKRVVELGALMVDPRYMVFCCNKMTLCPHPCFLREVLSTFHINQDVHLLVFYSTPHSLRKAANLHTECKKRSCLLLWYDWVRQSFSQNLYIHCGKNERSTRFHQKTVKMGFRMHLNLIWCLGICILHLGWLPVPPGLNLPLCLTEERYSSQTFVRLPPGLRCTFSQDCVVVCACRTDMAFGETVLWSILNLPPQHPPPYWGTAQESPDVEQSQGQ